MSLMRSQARNCFLLAEQETEGGSSRLLCSLLFFICADMLICYCLQQYTMLFTAFRCDQVNVAKSSFRCMYYSVSCQSNEKHEQKKLPKEHQFFETSF